MPADGTPEVLVVDDDPQVLELFVQYLEESYAVVAAESGRQALDRLSATTDVVLLDRRMPDMSGREVLEAIRERGHPCRVAMVTAVEPDLDIVDMEFDDYIVKPVTRSKLENSIDSLLGWDEYDAVLREYFETAQKIEVLEAEHRRVKLEDSDRYRELKRKLASLRSEADAARTQITAETLATISERDEHQRTTDDRVRFGGE